MKLNIVIPTYNRADNLKKTLKSILKAKLPKTLNVVVTVVDNNCNDHTKNVVEVIQHSFNEIKLEYLIEKKQGKSYALNTGINIADGDIFCCIDDDIEVTNNWFVEIEKLFRERGDKLDFVSGKMLPNWEIEPPSWIEPLKESVLSLRDFGEDEWEHSINTPMMSGGHGIIKLKVIKEIGLYDETLGPVGKNFVGCEDDIVYDKLINANKKGIYCPKLVVHHYVPRYRLSKSYYRNWCFGAGIAWDLTDKNYKQFEGKRFLGVPKYLYRDFMISFKLYLSMLLRRNETEKLASERLIWVFIGYFYNRNLKDRKHGKIFNFIIHKVMGKVER